MDTLDLSYHLPASRLRLSSSVTTTSDTILAPGGKGVKVPETTVALEIGPSKRSLTLQIPAGWFRNTGASVELTDEGLLKSSSIESSGQMGKVLVGVVGMAATVAGAMINPGGALPLAALNLLEEVAFADTTAPPAAEEVEAAAFRAHDREAADRRERLTRVIANLKGEAIVLAERLLDAREDESPHALYARLREIQRASALMQAELDMVNDLFKAWRATTIHTSTIQYERLLSLAEVRNAQPRVDESGKLRFDGTASAQVKFAWTELGVALAVDEDLPAVDGDATPGENEILIRVPRMVTIDLYERGAGGEAVLKESKPHLVMDSNCATETVELRKSIWAKRSVEIGFSDLGALKSYNSQVDSAAAAAADTAGGLPATATASLENVLKAREALGSLDSSRVKQQLAKTKAEVELKQQELTRDGLKATSADHAELERLKQRAAILEQRKTLRGARPAEVDPVATEIAELKQKVELLTLRAEAAWLDS